MQALNQILEVGLKFGGLGLYKDQAPNFIYSNLKDRFGQRPYQQKALGRFVFYWNEYQVRPKGAPIHLLYNMATGSGKTIMIPGLIIYLYERGCCNFLFKLFCKISHLFFLK